MGHLLRDAKIVPESERRGGGRSSEAGGGGPMHFKSVSDVELKSGQRLSSGKSEVCRRSSFHTPTGISHRCFERAATAVTCFVHASYSPHWYDVDCGQSGEVGRFPRSKGRPRPARSVAMGMHVCGRASLVSSLGSKVVASALNVRHICTAVNAKASLASRPTGKPVSVVVSLCFPLQPIIAGVVWCAA